MEYEPCIRYRVTRSDRAGQQAPTGWLPKLPSSAQAASQAWARLRRGDQPYSLEQAAHLLSVPTTPLGGRDS